MIHGINKQVLYSAVRVECKFKSIESQKNKVTSGTAFFCKIKETLMLVTNRHVVDPSYRHRKYGEFELSSLTLTGRLHADELVKMSVILPVAILFHPSHYNDIAVIKCNHLKVAAESEVRVDYFIPESMIARAEDFQSDIEICDFVAFSGYPTWYDRVEDRPLLRVGTIASDPSKNYHFGEGENAIEGDCVAYEAFSYGGSSGSPVFALQKGLQPGIGVKFEAYRPARFIGINGGHLPSSDSAHSGLSYFYRSSLLFDFVCTRSETTDETSD